jgi:GNAT superfamily N-acetyltransferase
MFEVWHDGAAAEARWMEATQARAQPIIAFSSLRSAERARLIELMRSVDADGARAPVALDDGEFGEGATHLVAAQPRRTLKVLFALARGAWIIAPGWLEACGAAGRWLDPAPFEFDELPGGRRSRLARRDGRDGRLLAGMAVHVAGATNTPASALSYLLRALGATLTLELADAELVVEGGLATVAAGAGAGERAVRLSEADLLSAVEAYELPAMLVAQLITPTHARMPLEPRAAQRAPAGPPPSSLKYFCSRGANRAALPPTGADAYAERSGTCSPVTLLDELPTPPHAPPSPGRTGEQMAAAGGDGTVSQEDWLEDVRRSVDACVRVTAADDGSGAAAALHGPALARLPHHAPTRVLPRRQSGGGGGGVARGDGTPSHALECGAWALAGGARPSNARALTLHVIGGRGDRSSEYFVVEDVLALYRQRLRGCNVDLHAERTRVPAEATEDAAPSPVAKRGARARPPAAAKRKRCSSIDFLGELLAGSAKGRGGRQTIVLTADDSGAPLAALTLHVHVACGVAEILLTAVKQTRARRGLGRALVECALHVLRRARAVRAVVCLASLDSVGFWSKLGFSRETDLAAEAWDALCDPFDDSIILQLDRAVLETCCTREGGAEAGAMGGGIEPGVLKRVNAAMDS